MAPSSRKMLKQFWGKPVLIEGWAIFSPSGAFLRLDGEAIRLARKVDGLFSEIPKALFGKLDMCQLRQPQTAKSGMAAFLGCWPGDETEEEILEALKAIG